MSFPVCIMSSTSTSPETLARAARIQAHAQNALRAACSLPQVPERARILREALRIVTEEAVRDPVELFTRGPAAAQRAVAENVRRLIALCQDLEAQPLRSIDEIALLLAAMLAHKREETILAAMIRDWSST